MRIKYIDNLLQTSMKLRYQGRSLTIDHLVIDTGPKRMHDAGISQ